MGLGYHNLVVADARVMGLHGQPALSGYRFRISIQFLPTAGSPAHTGIQVFGISAVVRCAGAHSPPKYLGRAYPEAPIWLRNLEHPQPTSYLFELDLTAAHLAALEHERGGGELSFEVELHATATQQEQHVLTTAILTYTSHLSEWSRVLNEFGYADLMVIGIPIQRGGAPDLLGDARDRLSRAYQDILHGRYDDAVGRARKVIEGIWAVTGADKDAALAAKEYFAGDRKKMTKDQRALFVQEAVRHYAHPPHHVEDDGNDAWYSAEDAAFTVALASAVLAQASSQLHGSRARRSE